MEYYNLYKLGRYGFFHVTSFKCESLRQAINYYKETFNACDFKSKKVGSYKITGL